MRTLEEIKSILKDHKAELFKKYPLKSIGIFGSYARGEQREDSDIDILVEYKKPMGVNFIDLSIELQEKLRMQVDLVSKKGIKPKYFSYLNRDIVYV